MYRSLPFFAFAALLVSALPVHAAPTIGAVTPTTATAGVATTFSATVSSGVAIQSCTLWVDLAEIGPMTVSNGKASRSFTFASGGARIAFVFCRDINGGIASGATTGINVAGAIQQSGPLEGSGEQSPPESEPQPAPGASQEITTTSTEPLVTESSSSAGRLLKAICDAGADMNDPCRAVYYIGKDGKRHAFPTSRIFFTWYSGFESVEAIPSEELSAFPLGANVKYRAGVRMVKFTTDPKVYAVSRGGVLRWVTSEELAKAYYGDTWNTHIDDIPDSFYADYTFGDDIQAVEDYNPEAELMNSTE